MDVINGFENGKWMGKAEKDAKNPEKLNELSSSLSGMFDKGGLASVLSELKLLAEYVKDVASGRYTGYSTMALIKIVAVVIYVVSPVDIIPDFILALGFTDDVAVVLWGVKQVAGELEAYKKWKYGK